MTRFKDDLTNVDDSNAIGERKRRIGKTLATMGVLDGLSKAQREQMTNSVFSQTQTYQVVRKGNQEQRQPTGFTDRKLRRLHTRVARLMKAFGELVTEAAAIDPAEHLWNWIGGDALEQVLEELGDRVGHLQGPAKTGPRRPSSRSDQNIRTICSKILLLEFRLCGVPKGPASSRVARIENVFWEGNIRETDEGTNRKRSSAIMKRLSRPSTRR